jgi:hypothetical protein
MSGQVGNISGRRSIVAAPFPDGEEIILKYGINGIYACQLNKITGFKLIVICDDSTSMRELLLKGETKWNALQESLRIVLDIACAYNVEVDVLFLNRIGFRNVKNISQLDEQFSTEPYGMRVDPFICTHASSKKVLYYLAYVFIKEIRRFQSALKQ